eukprot:CAMPEP_0181419612 /NCGR_PEP_ID=MMETSP1110-20121109/12162_1 /TAXON_ID=174948 /ORGANISM="Symbiodinium sp., Strain CCMP421" /LENGTH=260 /DNA_ID=CAMNT_0023542631 /DNA_START=61 /DNA_END=840 /DNA_ORIENTATION=-
MTAHVVPMFDLGWNVPVFAVYPVIPVPMVQIAVGMAPFQMEDAGLMMRQAMAEMPVHFKHCAGEALPRWRILCYGDSLTAGFFAGGMKFEPYGRTMSEVLSAGGYPCEVSVCGHSGCTTRDMLDARQTELADVVAGLSRILDAKPYDLVIIMSGTNDMGRGTCSSTIVEDLSHLHAVCHDRGVPTMVLAPPPAPAYGQMQEVQRQYLCQQLRHFASCSTSVCAFLDPADLVSTANGQLWEGDGLHFAPNGSQALGLGLAP